MKKLIACMMLSVAAAGACAWAQTPGTSTTEPGAELSKEAQTQIFIKQQFDKLKKAMLDVALRLEKADPESAKALRQAVDQANAAEVSNDMAAVIEKLQSGLSADAAGKEGDILAELRKVLAILREGALKTSDLDKAIQMSAQIGKMIPEQKELADKSELARDAAKISQQMADLAQRLKDVVSEQKELIKQSEALKEGDPAIQKLAELRQQVQELLDKQESIRQATDTTTEPDKLAVQGEQQKNLAEKASRVAKNLDAAAGDAKVGDALKKAGADSQAMSKASASTAKASKSMNQAGESLSKTDPDGASRKQDQAVYDLRQALDAMDNAMAKASEKTPAGQIAQKQKDLQQRTDQIQKDAQALADKTNTPTKTDNLSKASEEMGKAGDKLSGQKPQDALANQKEALRNLEDKQLNKLGELERRLTDKLKEKADDQARKQGDLNDRMKKLADEMSQKSEKQPNGMPGKDSMSKAGESGKSAQGKLSKGQSGEANSDQREAVKKMQEAKQQLDEAIVKAQDDQQEKTMTKIAEILQDMLTRQTGLSAKTRDVDSKRGGDGKFQRPEELALKDVSLEEGVLADDSKKVVKLLEDDHSTTVFPEVMKDIESDLRDLQTMLDAMQCDQLAQAMQGEVERNLSELLDSLKKAMSTKKNRSKSGGGGGQPGPPKKEPLVPPIAELKLIKQREIGLKTRTVLVSAEKAANKLPPAQVEAHHRKLAEDQKKIEAYTRDLAKLLNSQKGPGQ